jgi:hypothetical protein
MPHAWEQLALYAHYQIAVAMHEDLQAGHMEDGLAGLEECIEASSRSDERALKSSLVLLMQPIITWKVHHERCSTRRSAPMEEAWGRYTTCRRKIPSLRMSGSTRGGQKSCAVLSARRRRT